MGLLWALMEGSGHTHSPELLWDEGTATDEVLLLRPSGEGTEVKLGADRHVFDAPVLSPQPT